MLDKELMALAKQGEDGRHWYYHAREQVEALAAMVGCGRQEAARVVAQTSPRTSVKKNIRLAKKWLESGDESGMLPSVRASLKNNTFGPKTRAFYEALVGDDDAVVVDVWVARAFCVDERKVGSLYVLQPIQKQVRKVAARLGWKPAEAQAAIWTASVRAAGRNPGSFPNVNLLPVGATRDIIRYQRLDGEGPYNGNGRPSLSSWAISGGQPTPEMDDGWDSEWAAATLANWRCGFSSGEQERAWFDVDDRAVLAAHGFERTLITVREEGVLALGKQTIFRTEDVLHRRVIPTDTHVSV